MRLALGIFATLILAQFAPAHETWLLPKKFAVEVGKPTSFDLTSGMTFPEHDHAIKSDRTAFAKFRIAGKTHDFKDPVTGEKSLAFAFTPDAAGIGCAWVTLKPRRIELNEDQVAHYFDEINAPEAIRKGWLAAPKPRQWREVYVKHAKSFVRVGASDDSWEKPTGQDLEIVPRTDPTRLKAGDSCEFQVSKNGKPLAGFAIGVLSEGAKKPTWHATDKDGRIRVKFDTAGRVLIYGTDLRVSKLSDTDYESDFATLTLEIGK